MFEFTTKTGSKYEVCEATKLIRRYHITSESGTTERVCDEFKEYISLVCELGEPAIIIWPEGVPLLQGSPDHAIPATVTSEVVSIVKENKQ